MLQLRNSSRRGRLGDVELVCSFRDAAPLCNRIKEFKVAQPQSPANDFGSFHGCPLCKNSMTLCQLCTFLSMRSDFHWNRERSLSGEQRYEISDEAFEALSAR